MFKKLAVTTVSLVAIMAIGYFVQMSVGKSISSDLSVIGQGKPALVLAYENYSPAGGEALNRLRQVKSDYDSRIDFIVADLSTPQGQAFANRYQLFDGQAIFLKPNGKPLQVTGIPADEQKLRLRLESKLSALE
jgi:hypothetical protein